MLSYNIRDLEQHAVTVQGELPADDAVWQEGDRLPVDAVQASGRLSPAGTGRFYWSGRIEGAARAVCRRCLADTQTPVSEEVHVIFAEEGGVEGDDPDVFRLDANTSVVDLRAAVREQWLLGVPAFAVCREECKGLCARCGSDLNAGPCDCPPETDSRWESLRKLRDAPGERP
jgi:uncharacterized protein